MKIRDFRALRIHLASPKEIRSWSYGEVTRPETINYRHYRPEPGGLFCEAIFGPVKDWQCHCGKYKGPRYKDIVCEQCGVLVTRSAVRRERMGHIELVMPVAHIWYTRRVPSYLGILLDLSRRNLDGVLYYAQPIITYVDEAARSRALMRLEHQLADEQDRLEAERQAQVDHIRGRVEERIAVLRQEFQTFAAGLDEQQSTSIQAVMQEAQILQRQIDYSDGQPLAEPLFSQSGQEIVANAGERLSQQHLSILNQAVEACLNEIQAEIETELARSSNQVEAKIQKLRYQAEQEIETLNRESSKLLDELTTQIETQRLELCSLQPTQLITEAQYQSLTEQWGKIFRAGMGAEALYEICRNLDVDELASKLRTQMRTIRSRQLRKKAVKRLRVVDSLRRSGNRPEWMFLIVLPVIPPRLRPLVQLGGGRFATSDLNDLYRRVINRNNRLKRLLELGAPEVIIRNEKRMLQEAVDSLIDNSRRRRAVSARGRRQLKSLSDILVGKQGRFRRNLLGKRVDYSGRSVIVVGPELKLHQCGLPKTMALELFRPFVLRKLVEHGYAVSVREAKHKIEQRDAEVWEVLAEVIKTRPILLNRAPTLHRLGIQAFEPVLIEGDAIRVHPLVCPAFNADFDGDQMAVHVPLSPQAIDEARELMLAPHNLLLPASGEAVVTPTKDMVLGVYYLTLAVEDEKGAGKIFTDLDEVALAYSLGKVGLHAKIQLLHYSADDQNTVPFETTIGRAVFNQILPPALRYVNQVLDKGALRTLVDRCYHRLGPEVTAQMVDALKTIGFQYATQSGITISMSDIKTPEIKEFILEEATAQSAKLEQQYRRGLITKDERYVKTIKLWTEATDQVKEAVRRMIDPASPLKLMADSGATKGGFQPIAQLAGMRGLMADPSGRIIDLPIRSNFREGLTVLEYFISTHGARKGLADTALRTADAGYLTRRLIDAAHDVFITQHPCTCDLRAGLTISKTRSEAIGARFRDRLIGRTLFEAIIDPATGEVLVEKNTLIDNQVHDTIARAGVEAVTVYSPLCCGLERGLCAQAYGSDLARDGFIAEGSAVGIIAAQSIGEPGTQLTLRTFHTGGVAGVEDITHGLPRVQELFEARTPKGEAIISDLAGQVELVTHEDGSRVLQVIAREPDEEVEYELDANARLRVKAGDRVVIGQKLTEGSLNPHRILQLLGREAVQRYLLEEIQKVYRSQGVPIHDKHIETIIRQMTNKVRIIAGGDSRFLPGDLVNYHRLERINQELIRQGQQPATGQPILLGLTKAALQSDSFLSASSFQHTVNVLAKAALEGKRDNLFGLKENVILGKLIPVGTGYRASSPAVKDSQTLFDEDELDIDTQAQVELTMFEDQLLV